MGEFWGLYVKWYSRWAGESHSAVSDSLWPHGLYSSWNSPGHNPGVGSLSLLQGIFLPQGSNPGLPRCRQILYQLSHQGSPSEIREISQSKKDKHHVVLFIWDRRIAKLRETENRRVLAKVRQAWDTGLSAAVLQCLHLDTPLLEQHNAKKFWDWK